MEIQKDIAKKLVWDGIISLFLYALPIVLMMLYFYAKGERPWEKNNSDKASKNQSIIIDPRK